MSSLAVAAPRSPDAEATPAQSAEAADEAVALLADVLAVWRLSPLPTPALAAEPEPLPAVLSATTRGPAVGRSPAPVTAGASARADPRRCQGQIFSSKPLGQPRRLLHGQQQCVAKLPASVAVALKGRPVHSFAQARRAVWRALAASAYASEFGPGAAELMAAGMAPAVPNEQRLGRRRLYELHHLRPLHCHPEGLYDLANLVVVTPLYHHAVLHPSAHYRRRR